MKVSVSTRPEYFVAAVWLAAHLPSLAPALEDIDSLNFALGLREFDPAKHQPHPPGYPVYIALGRMALAVVSRVPSSLDRMASEALALSIVSAIAGAVAIVAAAAFYRALEATPPGAVAGGPDRNRRTAAWAVALLAAAPLFWFTGLRPMSDMPGLAATLVALALTAKGM